MAEYENREARFNSTLPGIMASFALGMAEADNAMKDAYIERQIRLLNGDNAEFIARTSLVGLDECLETNISVPRTIVAPSEPAVIEQANMSMDMTVSASTVDNLSVSSETEAEGEAGFNAGMFSGNMRLKANVSVAKDQKRASDYTSTVHADLSIRQGRTPEGLQKIIDAMNRSVDKALELNADIVEQQYETLVAAKAS